VLEDTREEIRSWILQLLNDFLTLFPEYRQHPETIAMKARWSSTFNPNFYQTPDIPDFKHTHTNNCVYNHCYQNNLDTQLCDNPYDDTNTFIHPKYTLINKYHPTISVNLEGSGSDSSPPSLSGQDIAPTTLSGGRLDNVNCRGGEL